MSASLQCRFKFWFLLFCSKLGSIKCLHTLHVHTPTHTYTQTFLIVCVGRAQGECISKRALECAFTDRGTR